MTASPHDPDKTERPTGGSMIVSATAGLALASAAALIAVSVPDAVFDPATTVFILSIGLIGIWRYGWWTIHLIRSVLYRRWVFPRLRDRAMRADRHPDHVHVLVTSFRIPPETTYRVYESIVRTARDYGVPTTIYASISDRSDVDVLEALLQDQGWPAGISVRYLYQRGDGKRSAMADVLRTISRAMPTQRSVVVFMDGDIRLPVDTFRRSMPYFHDRSIGAVTTHNRGIVAGDDVTREWYDLRYAQRNLLMSSMALSRRLLVLTGRFSLIRADLATQRSFIDQIENDSIRHWRFGEFKFLSGDDKSTWFWLLSRGWKMLYLPDVEAHGYEELPNPDRFVASSLDLMRRWYGNMLRISGRAIALGPRPMGLFTWWALVDQRLSIWTSLIGPTVAIMMTLFVRPSFLLVYALWILGTRLLVATMLGLQHGRFSFLWPPLLYWNQVVGALLKTQVSFRFNRQKWSRQGISAGEPASPFRARWQRRISAGIHGVALAGFLFLVSLTTGVLPKPELDRADDLAAATDLVGAPGAAETGWWIARALDEARDGAVVRLPEGEYRLAPESLAEASGELAGISADETVLRLDAALLDRARGGVPAPGPRGTLHCTPAVPCRLDTDGAAIRIRRAALTSLSPATRATASASFAGEPTEGLND